MSGHNLSDEDMDAVEGDIDTADDEEVANPNCEELFQDYPMDLK